MTERGFMTRRKTVAFAIASVLAFGGTLGAISVPALAEDSSELQAQLDAANSQLTEIGYQLAAAQEDLNTTVVQLNDTNSKIDQLNSDIAAKQEELAAEQETLGKRVSANYKAGGVDLLSLVLDSSSFEDLFERIYYADKVAESDAATIDTVKTLQAELEQQQSELTEQKEQQETLVAQQTEQTQSLQSQVQDQQAYVNSLSDEVKAAVEAEAEAQAQAAQEAAANAAATAGNNAAAAIESTESNAAADAGASDSSGASDNGGNASTDTGTGSNAGSNADTGANANAGSNTNAGSNASSNTGSGSKTNTSSNTNTASSSKNTTSSSTSSSTTGGGLTSAQRSAILSAAYSAIGVPYVYGGSSFSGFDCSGLTMYCYAQAGISLPHSASAQTAYFTSESLSQAQAGDLIWYSGHVGIYVGNNTILHAPYPGTYVRTEKVWSGYYMVGTYR